MFNFKLSDSLVIPILALALPITALADVTNKIATLSTGQTLNLDTGATGTSGGDLMWDGTNLNPQGSAKDFDLAGGNQTLYNALGLSELSADLAIMMTSPITPAVNDVIVAHTNGGNFAKVLVTAINGTSITVEFTTYGGSGGGGGNTPTITKIQNNYSNIPPGLPNYGIAQGSLFVIYGSGLVSTTNIEEKFPCSTSRPTISTCRPSSGWRRSSRSGAAPT